MLAYRGFLCQDYASFFIGWFKNPPFTRDKGQLEQKEVDWSRNLSAIRIVIERFIGVVK